MLKKILAIYTFACFAIVGVQASMEQEINEEILKQTQEETQSIESEKQASPDLLACKDC